MTDKVIVYLGGWPDDIKWFYEFYNSINDENKFMPSTINRYLAMEPIEVILCEYETLHKKLGAYLEFKSQEDLLAFKLRWS